MPRPVEQSDGPSVPEKKDIRIAQPPQAKLNGQQQPGILPQYRPMIPPYVSKVHQDPVGKGAFIVHEMKGELNVQ